MPAQQACRLIDPPAGAWLEAVSSYEPEGAEHWFRSKRIPMPIAVHVTRPSDIVLVLNTSEPAIWRVSAGADSRIAAVLLSGNYTSSRISGLRVQYVPYRGTAPALNDLVAGQIDIVVDQASNSMQQIRGGNIRAYA
jgi:hypothetical protein